MRLFAIIRWRVIAPAALLLILLCTNALASFSGAVYTTTSNGLVVNQNRFPTRADVYLNGGPQNSQGSLLTNGIYFYEVDNPSNHVLLSTDNAVCRQLQVVNGRIYGAYTNGGTIACAHPNGIPNQANGSISVRLAPFNFTPNNGGEYQVVLVRQTDGNGNPIATTFIDSHDPKVIHYDQNDSKSDNFKIKGNTQNPLDAAIGGFKFNDLNGNGVWDLNEPALKNVTVTVYNTS